MNKILTIIFALMLFSFTRDTIQPTIRQKASQNPYINYEMLVQKMEQNNFILIIVDENKKELETFTDISDDKKMEAINASYCK